MSGDTPKIASPAVWGAIRWATRTLVVPYFSYRVRGLDQVPDGGLMVLSNHQSFADPLFVAVGIPRPVSFMARSNLFGVPVVGSVLRGAGTIPVNRGGASSLREPIRRLQAGQCVGLFPEGTRTRDGRVAEVKPGFVALVRRAKVPIVFCGIAGAFEAWPRTNALPRPGRVRTVLGEPMSSDEVGEWAVKGREAEFAAEAERRLKIVTAEAEAWRAA